MSKSCSENRGILSKIEVTASIKMMAKLVFRTLTATVHRMRTSLAVKYQIVKRQNFVKFFVELGENKMLQRSKVFCFKSKTS